MKIISNVSHMARPKNKITPPPSDFVRRVRDAHGLTQEELAREIGCSTASVAKLEQERRIPKNAAVRANLVRLADAKGVERDA
jgi:transcriptional regulator with XRE-family HTH domain